MEPVAAIPPPNIIERIRKLMALSTANGATPQEAANAAGIVSRLLVKYRLEGVDLGTPEEAISDQGAMVLGEEGDPKRGWKTHLATAVALSADCRLFFRRSGSVLVGRKGDAEIARYLYLSIVQSIEFQARQATPALDWAGRPMAASEVANWRRSFALGAMRVIVRRLEDAKREATGEIPPDRALVLVKRSAAVEDWIGANLKIGGTRKSSLRGDGHAMREGERAGVEIDIAPRPNLRRLGGAS